MALNVSPTLLDAVDWYNHCPAKFQTQAFESIVSKVTKQPYTTSKAAEKGLLFEQEVQNFAEGKPVQDLSFTKQQEFIKIACALRGMTWQSWIDGFINLPRWPTVRLLGRIDAYNKNVIIDLKTTSNYRGPAKYQKGWQHKFYSYCTGIPVFKYVVAEWEDADSLYLTSVHEIQIKSSLTSLKKELTLGLTALFDFLDTHELYETYVKNYTKD